MAKKKLHFYTADFETTVDGDKNQDKTEVWASAIVELFDDFEHVEVGSSIDKFMSYIELIIPNNSIIYFHNLKFDGTFIIDWLLKNGFKFAFDEKTKEIKKSKELKNKEFTALISDMGQWYFIECKINGKIITFRDSLKLLPFSVKKLGKDFGTKHRKLEIEYKGERHANGVITSQEK